MAAVWCKEKKMYKNTLFRDFSVCWQIISKIRFSLFYFWWEALQKKKKISVILTVCLVPSIRRTALFFKQANRPAFQEETVSQRWFFFFFFFNLIKFTTWNNLFPHVCCNLSLMLCQHSQNHIINLSKFFYF